MRPGLKRFKPFDRKLVRDLWLVKGQVLAIAVVIAAGVAAYILSVAASDSLHQSQQKFYRDYRFAHVFVDLKRAPLGVAARIRQLPGVNQVQTSVSNITRVSIEGFPDTITARLLSVPDNGQPVLNRLYLRQGRFPRLHSRDEVIVSDGFFEAHKLRLGDRVSALVNGVYRDLVVVGVALSPEYIYQLSPGQFIPDAKRFAILWMSEKTLASAYNMTGATNSIAISLAPGVDRKEFIAKLDLILERYGSLGAISRKDQTSHRYLTEEFKQLGHMAFIYPVIFLSVAVFLLNIVISRIVSTQREQIGIIKAFGYSNFEVGLHYFKFVTVIVFIGLVAGIALGLWLGHGMSQLYAEFYRFPKVVYAPPGEIYVVAILINLSAAYLGSWFAVKKAVKLTPTEAMRPPPPSRYHRTLVDLPVLRRVFSRLTRMIARNLGAQPVKTVLAIVGIAMSCAVMVVGNYFNAALDHMLKYQYLWAQQEDVVVNFSDNYSSRGLSTIRKIDGVTYVEPHRILPVRFRKGHREVRTGIYGIRADSKMKLFVDTQSRTHRLPEQGLVLTDYLAKMLKVKPGETVDVEILEGKRTKAKIKVVKTITEYLGIAGYMSLASANRLAGDYRLMNGAYLMIEQDKRDAVIRQLREIPTIVGVAERRKLIPNFLDTLGETVLTFVSFMIAFAASIAFGVVYNNARISLSERSRELASMRVLGFTRGEISYILLGELAILTLIAIPLGFVFGYLLCYSFVISLQNELYRIPLHLDVYTYSLAAATVIVSAMVSGLIVRRRIDRLDLVAVLKTRE